MKVCKLLNTLSIALLLSLCLGSVAQTGDEDEPNYRDQVQIMYLAYYGRPGDAGGLDFWAGKLEEVNGRLKEIINEFGTSKEFTDRFGDLDDEELVDNIFLQLLGRPADNGGLNFYVNGLREGRFTPASLALDIVKGTQKKPGGRDAETVANKLQAANDFSKAYVEADAPYGESQIDDAKQWLGEVDSTSASVTAARDRLPDLLEMLANKAPSASFTATPHSGPAPLAVSFDASASVDSDGEIVSFEWDFAGFAEASGMLAEHTFTEPGVHPVRLTVTDDLGGVHSTVFELNAEDGSGVAFTVPYVVDGRYAEDLRPCIYNGVGGGCSLERLPFLGAEFSEPSVEDVMTRVLVSHRWMGDNFRAILERLPADLRLLTRSVTAIVIASDIRPAYYWGATGAIYLDADFFWLTPQQQSVVTMEEDFRTDFGNQLQVELPWRYVRNNQRWSISLTPDGYQRLEDLTQVTAFLLYHELAHAADFMPVSLIASLDPSKTAYEAIDEAVDDWPSSGLNQAHPLNSQVMEDLGRVFFRGQQPTPTQIAIQPDDLIDEFSTDGAVDFYSYASQFEDLADLLETLLMSYHQGLEKDTAITSMKTVDTPDRTVAWGQRGRMTDLAVIERLRWTIDAMYPGNTHDLHGYLTGRPAPLPMRRGDTWVNNIALEDGDNFNSGGSAITPPRTVYQPTMFPNSRKTATPSGLIEGAASQRQPISHIGGAVTPSGLPESESDASSSPTLVGCIRISENSPPAMLERLGLDPR